MTTEVSSRESPPTFVDFHSHNLHHHEYCRALPGNCWRMTSLFEVVMPQMLHPQIIFLLAKPLNWLERSQNQSHGRVRALPTTGSAGIWICVCDKRSPSNHHRDCWRWPPELIKKKPPPRPPKKYTSDQKDKSRFFFSFSGKVFFALHGYANRTALTFWQTSVICIGRRHPIGLSRNDKVAHWFADGGGGGASGGERKKERKKLKMKPCAVRLPALITTSDLTRTAPTPASMLFGHARLPLHQHVCR